MDWRSASKDQVLYTQVCIVTMPMHRTRADCQDQSWDWQSHLHSLTIPLSVKSSSSPSSLPPVNSLNELNRRIPAKSNKTGFQLSMSSLPNRIMTSLKIAAVPMPYDSTCTVQQTLSIYRLTLHTMSSATRLCHYGYQCPYVHNAFGMCINRQVY